MEENQVPAYRRHQPRRVMVWDTGENSIKSLRDKELRMVQMVVVRIPGKTIRYPVWHYASHVAYFGIMGMSPRWHRQSFISVRRLIIPARMCLRYEGHGMDVSWLHGYHRRDYTVMDGVTLVLTTTRTTQWAGGTIARLDQNRGRIKVEQALMAVANEKRHPRMS